MSKTVEFQSVLAIVADFVERNRGALPKPITATTKLLQEGLIDSFALVELIAELEERLQLDLPGGSLIPEDFETTTVLHERIQELLAD